MGTARLLTCLVRYQTLLLHLARIAQLTNLFCLYGLCGLG